MVNFKKFNDLQIERGCKNAHKEWQINNGVDRYAGLLSTPSIDRYGGLMGDIEIESCIEDGYYAIMQIDKATKGVLAIIFDSAKERDNYIENNDKYAPTDFEGFKAITGDGWMDINRYFIDPIYRAIVYNEEPETERT